ncbi:MAG TPA: hypothetical protein VEU94_08445 [Terriglobales bacterium]|nr:hypothetical protein [Terriglobales bacterium]
MLTSLALSCLLSPGLLAAQNLTVIGGTSFQKQLTACIERVAAEDLDKVADLDHSMTIIILEHDKFLQVKDSFRAYRTKLGFSNLATRRMYLSADVFRNLDTAMLCIPHELGHFVTRSVYEDHAELAAAAIRKRAREGCTMPAVPAPPRALSSQVKTAGPAGIE